jgi:hypothetical protein
MRGSRMALTWNSCGFTDCSAIGYLTRDGFAHSSWTSLGEDQIHFLGFVRVGGELRLADAFSGPRRVRYRHAT